MQCFSNRKTTMPVCQDFAAQLKSLPNITRHIHLAEAVNRTIGRQSFRDRVSVEQSLLDGRDIDRCCETIEVMHFTLTNQWLGGVCALCTLLHRKEKCCRKWLHATLALRFMNRLKYTTSA